MNLRTTRTLAALVTALIVDVHAADGGLPGPVVNAQWLASHLDQVTVLDVRSDVDAFTGTPEFEANEKTGAKTLVTVAGHIPKALLVDFDRTRSPRMIGGRKVEKMLPEKAAFEAVMQEAGLSAGQSIVITANGQTVDEMDMAARLYWSLKVYGEDRIAILDGGDAGWLAAGQTLVSDKPVTTRGDWKATAERRELLAEATDVEKAAAAKVQLVDARPLPQYAGLTFKKPLVTAGGHIGGARNLPTDVHTKAAGGAQIFLTPAEYRGMMALQGIDPEAPSISYCNTGHLASGAWFVMSEVLGNRSVKLYDGSMHDWTHSGHPVVSLATGG
ncbi:MAG: sulfurtransferase [Xanthomonadaceae bacterium]|nr:sulfurtransferase [Xanthomonadaceae bacterium]